MALACNAHDPPAWWRCYVAALLFVKRYGSPRLCASRVTPAIGNPLGRGEPVLQTQSAGGLARDAGVQRF